MALIFECRYTRCSCRYSGNIAQRYFRNNKQSMRSAGAQQTHARGNLLCSPRAFLLSGSYFSAILAILTAGNRTHDEIRESSAHIVRMRAHRFTSCFSRYSEASLRDISYITGDPFAALAGGKHTRVEIRCSHRALLSWFTVRFCPCSPRAFVSAHRALFSCPAHIFQQS